MRSFLIFLAAILTASFILMSCSKPKEPTKFELPQPVVDQLMYCLKAKGTVFIKSEIGKDSCEYIASPRWSYSPFNPEDNQIMVGIDYTHKANCKNHK